ncbi:MAG: hypothetical protein ACQEWV_29565 [Bacillota bacterium]
MRKFGLFLGLFFVSLIISVCNEETNNNSNTEGEVIENPTVYRDADIFMLNGIVYKNAEDIDWVNERKLTLGEEVTEITKQTTDSKQF